MHRQGVNFTEEQVMKSMIAAGKSWAQIKVHLTHVDEEYVHENLYKPLAAEFKEKGSFTSGAPIKPAAHEEAALGVVASAKALNSQKAALDKRASDLDAKEKALAAKEKELAGLGDLIGKKKGS